MSSTAGTRNAKVLPEPVLAEATTSRPSSRGGIALACISVMLVKPMSSIAFNVFSQTRPSRAEKGAPLSSPNVRSEPGTEKILKS